MPPSSDLPEHQKPHSNFRCVDWLSQSSCPRLTRISQPVGVSWKGLPAHASTPGKEESTQNWAMDGDEAETAALPVVQGRTVAEQSKKLNAFRAPRMRMRTAFTAEQISTLESTFQSLQYLGPQERKKLAGETQLTETQIKTWFQNRRMKHKRQMQDSQFTVSFSRPLCETLDIYPPYPVLSCSSLLVPPPLILPPCSFWGPCPVEQATLASWDPCHQLPATGYLPEPGATVQSFPSAHSREFCYRAWQFRNPKWRHMDTTTYAWKAHAQPAMALDGH